MSGGPPGERAAATLLGDLEEIARAVTDALYAERPGLSRYGASGREKCLQDMRFNLEHLAPAVAFGDPAMFVTYARWLATLLSARGIAPDDVVRSLQLMREAAGARMPPDEAALVATTLEAGIDAVREAT